MANANLWLCDFVGLRAWVSPVFPRAALPYLSPRSLFCLLSGLFVLFALPAPDVLTACFLQIWPCGARSTSCLCCLYLPLGSGTVVY